MLAQKFAKVSLLERSRPHPPEALQPGQLSSLFETGVLITRLISVLRTSARQRSAGMMQASAKALKSKAASGVGTSGRVCILRLRKQGGSAASAPPESVLFKMKSGGGLVHLDALDPH